MSKLYPILIDLRSRTVVIVGGGTVAARKARGVLDAGGRVRIVAPHVEPELENLGPTCEVVRRPYEVGDLDGAALVFAATDSPAVNATVAEHAAAHGLLCCRTDRGEASDFVTPAHAQLHGLVVACGGAGVPALAACLRDAWLRSAGAIDGLVEPLRTSREALASADPRARAAFWAALAARLEAGPFPTADAARSWVVAELRAAGIDTPS